MLFWEFGVTDISALAERLKRTVRAVDRHASELGLKSGGREDTISLTELARRAGRTIDVVKRVARSIGTHLLTRPRTSCTHGKKNVDDTAPCGKRYAIGEPVAERILAALRPLAGHDRIGVMQLGRWATEHDRCVRCRTTDRPHVARGLCTVCIRLERDAAEGRFVPDASIQLHVIAHEYGRDTHSMLRAAECAGVQLTRGAHRYYVLVDDIPKLRAVLDAAKGWKIGVGRGGVWGDGTKPTACLHCARTDRPHVSRGLCGACWQRDWRKRRQGGQSA